MKLFLLILIILGYCLTYMAAYEEGAVYGYQKAIELSPECRIIEEQGRL